MRKRFVGTAIAFAVLAMGVSPASASAESRLTPEFTMMFTNVDPVDNCLGLFNIGDLVAYEAVYEIIPGQEINSSAAEER